MTLTHDETLTLRRTAEASILYCCYEKIETKWHFLERRHDTVVGFVKGKGRLRKKVLFLMKTLTPELDSDFISSGYASFSQAFEEALRNLVKSNMIRVETEFPGSHVRKIFAITPTGVSAMKSYASMIDALRRIF